MRPNGVGHTNASTLLESHWNNFLTDKMCLVLVGIDLSLTAFFSREVIDPQCQVNCSCCVNQLCGLKEKRHYYGNDSCLKGCIDGYRGARCYIKCAEYCKACYHLNSNNCTKCHDGFYNGKYKNCSENCASNCKACGKGPDLCTKCHEGFYNGKYKNCSEECPAGCKACKSQESCSECNEGYYNGKEFDFERSTSLYNCTHRCRDTCTRCMSYSNCTGCVRGAFGTICEHECSVGCVNSTCQQSTGEKVADIRMLIGFSISTVLLLICIAVLVIILLKRTRPCQRHRKQQNQGDVHVKTKVEMTEISATEAENVKGCARTSSSEKPYEDLHEERDSTGDPKYQNTPQNSEMKIKLCKN
ncbi:proprotein convertase subtilisin/kexin type 5-like isoform X2 [Mercenaria mercenaria]|uniref:proprotein convertase subtilisin/kexin type 5-like isoform X2 n=1 Tax=Mercenaria mercenaria TaxID=6596 RepID=UPI00234FA6D1|nr:proprotein convertase subtilisin/kexin type 5-like isoform X2 [Mercenaria mercenaria]